MPPSPVLAGKKNSSTATILSPTLKAVRRGKQATLELKNFLADEYAKGKTTLLALSRNYNVPETTLRRWIYQRTNVQQKRGAPTTLPNEQEFLLVEYLLVMSDRGFGLCKQQVLNKVGEMIKANGISDSRFVNGVPGDKWWRLFLARHRNQLARLPEQPLQQQRANCANRQTLDHFYDLFEKLCNEHEFVAIYNADEKPVQLNGNRRTVRVGRNGTKGEFRIGADREHVTVLLCVESQGACLAPHYIMAGSDHNLAWTRNTVPGTTWAVTESGFSTIVSKYSWFVNHFLPGVRAVHPTGKVLLLLDGHTSNIDLDLWKKAKESVTYSRL